MTTRIQSPNFTPKSNCRVSRREFIKTTALAGAALATSTIGFPAVLRGAAPEIAIGHIHPLSGFLAFDGKQLQDGIMLAVKEINAAGGIKALDGAQLKVLTQDSEGKPDMAIRAVERLKKEGAVGILGCYQSSVTLVATQIAEKERIPFVVSVAVADEITGRGFKYTFRAQPNSFQMADNTLRHLREIVDSKGAQAKTLAHIHDNTAFGNPISAHVEKLAPNYGFELISKVPYSPKSPDVSTEVGKIKAAGADIILDTGYFGDSVRVYKTMRALKVKAQAVVGCANGGFSHPKFIQELGDITENVMDGNYRANPNSPMTQKTFAHYRDSYDTEMASHAVMAYQGVYILADALKRAGSTEGGAIRDALSQTNLTDHILPQEAIKFGPDGQNIDATAPMMQIQGGEVKVVWPAKYAQGQPVYPINM